MNKRISSLRLVAIATILFAGLFPALAPAASPFPVPITFAYTNDVGNHYYLCVIGNCPALGDWDLTRAVPLAWHDGNVWSATIAIPAGTELEYKFIRRSIDADFYTNPQADWFPDSNLTLSVPSAPDAPFDAKHVVFRCPWDPPVQIVWSTLSTPDYSATNDWHATDLVQTAPGRYEGYAGEPGEWMRFTFSGYENGEQKWYHFYGTSNEDFWSPLDAFCVDVGQVFDYEPVNGVSDSRFEEREVFPWPAADTEGVSNRTIRIYLPRGYNENTNRYYPVLYFADGQNIFSENPADQYGGWKVDTAADREIRGGRMREAILVGVPCRETPPPGASTDYTFAGRLWEYLPGTDVLKDPFGQLDFALQGNGFHYMNFLLGNVVPTLDYNYRTLRDPANTGHVGSSAGGLLSFWLGAYTNRFGLIGAVSGVYHKDYIPNFRTWCEGHIGELSTNKIKRIWLDTGTEETNVMGLNLYESNWDALTLLLYAGQIPNKTLHFGVYTGWAGEHNEKAWAARSADILDFLLDVRTEPNRLYAPIIPALESTASGYTLSVPLLGHTPLTLHCSTNLLQPRSSAPDVWHSPTSSLPWTNHPVSIAPTAPASFYFLSNP
ncbi:MAG: hypothetical protein ILO10_09380 [Kiritimatiellae bacterium]|nr:hypothetical protein [Kiritimatiellia bacterium]